MNLAFDFLDQQRMVGDELADQLVADYFASNNAKLLYKCLQASAPDLQTELLNEQAASGFLLSVRPLPDWYNSDKIRKGQMFFYRYATPIMNLLGGLALPYCYAATPGNKALYLSDKMRQSVGKRLIDTADFIIGVCSPGAFFDDSTAQMLINKTRIIHALARYYILQKHQWDMAWGLPINQEDMAGTNLAFSYIILQGLQKTGYLISEKEKENFIFLWRYIGYQLHVEETLLPNNFLEAVRLERSIRKRHFNTSEEGIILTKELLDYYATVLPQSEAGLIHAQVRYWLGETVADCLGLYPNPIKDTLVKSINFLRESSNFHSNKNSYDQMLAAHKQIKKTMLV